MSEPTLYRKLEQLIGGQFDYLDEVWILIEVLGDIDSIVIRRCKDCRADSPVQQNAYGAPNRRADGTLTLPISDQSGEGYSQDVLLLLEGRRTPPSGQ